MKGFKQFIMRGNVLDLAVAVVIGAAFTAVVMAHPRIVADTYNLASTVLPTQGTSRRAISGYLDYNFFSKRSIGRDDAQHYQMLTPIP